MTEALIELDDTKHYIFGGSSAKYWSTCFGWAGLMKQMPPEPAGPKAIRGSAIHKASERRINQRVHYERTGVEETINFKDIPNLPEEGPAIADAYWQSIWTKALEGFVTKKQILVEKELLLPHVDECGGTADLVVLHYNDKAQLVGVVGDLKTGDIIVEADCEQLLFYATVLYALVREKGQELTEVKVFIYQPTREEPYHEHIYKKAALERAEKKYRKAIEESMKEKPKFKVGDHCEYCKAKPKCKAYSKWIGEKMDLAVRDNKLPDVESLPDETIAQIYSYMPDLKKYLSAINKYVNLRFTTGKPIEGLKPVNGVARRRWKDEIVVEDTFKMIGVNPFTQKLMGITAVEAMLKNTGMPKEKIAEVMYTATEKPAPPVKIVPESDERPAIEVSSGVNLLLDLDEEVDV